MRWLQPDQGVPGRASRVAAGILPGVRTDPKTLLRGLAKLVAVVVAAGLAGALIGIGLAKLSGDDGGDAPALPAAASTTASSVSGSTTTTATTSAKTAKTATATTPATQTTTTQSGAAEPVSPKVAAYKAPRVEVLSAGIGSAATGTGRAPVTIRVRVTNRGGRTLTVPAPALLTGQDEVVIDRGATADAGALLRPLATGSSATGTLRFTPLVEATQRLLAKPRARLRIAKRVVLLKLTTASP